jgi:thioredoxin reductase (NADPH)/alkyl hydroperoxide reductase subunit F
VSAADLLIVGGGPAGCSAAHMAASLGMRSVLVEAGELCGKLHRVRALRNGLGGFASGTELAAAIVRDVTASPLCQVEAGVRAARVEAYGDHAAVTLDDGRRLAAPYAIVATGVGPRATADWLTVPDGWAAPSLWDAAPPERAGERWLVLGADRPLGTFLRAHPDADVTLVVACPPEDDDKTAEAATDPRVHLLPLTRLTLHADGTALTVRRDGTPHPLTPDRALLNLGSTPTLPTGDLTPTPDGYCAPAAQHPRLIPAGDIRSPRYQRIATALGSGAEAALHAYYAGQGLPE